jgi:multisubunit Na+/H+ antiporter MnhE subunit
LTYLCSKKVLHAISRFIIAYPFFDYFHSSLSHFYWLSDYFLVYYIIGYRKKVVRANLALALPHLSDKERVVIEKNHTAIYVTCLWK